ncbi:MAG: response regulator [Litorimonas sp.]
MNIETSMVLDGLSTQAPTSRSLPSSTTVFSGDVLLVEDNFIIAMDVEELLTELGAESVHVASNCDEALDVIERVAVTAAILDFRVEGGTSIRVADALVRKGIRFVFATGYSDVSLFPARYQAAPILKKPYSGHDIVAIFQADQFEFCNP